MIASTSREFAFVCHVTRFTPWMLAVRMDGKYG